jgi:UDP-N-acetyl-D-mannosaminuronate dehydrogenase
VVVADHDVIDWTLVLQYAPMIIDTRNVLGRLSPLAAKPASGSERRLRRGEPA